MLGKYRNRFLLALLFFVVLMILHYFRLTRFIDIRYVAEHKDVLISFINEHYAGAVSIYCAVYIAIVFFMLPITLVLNIAAGYFFGVIPGTLYSVASATIGALLSLLAFRYLIGDWVIEKYGDRLEKFKNNFRKNGISYLLSLQLLPVTPFPIINVCAGLSGIPIWTFVWTTLVGITPGTIIYTIAGQQLSHIKSVDKIMSWQMVLVLLVLSLLAFLPILLRKLKIIR